MSLSIIAAVAYASGRRQGRQEGQVVGITQAGAAFAAGLVKGAGS
ncbi:hypothetical protein [Nocardioides sp.]